ncbi:thioredoxin family protein [Psychroserpens damuponensis]|uniref:thioredoxin family protein n=1 Tax=Psychroserpens damuponensis TaxID=943936 RepID=UPI00058FCEA2|nr:thioredoxin family protein [Psychroserpens damuponensis]
MKTEIKILHSSCCAKGSPIKAQLEKIAQENELFVTIEELSELQDTMVYGTMSFPSIVVNGKVYDFKSFKSDADLITALKTV